MLWKSCLGLWVLLVIYGLSEVSSQPTYGQDIEAALFDGSLMMEDDLLRENSDLENEVSKDGAFDKRMERYPNSLGRRSYSFTNGGNGMKRLPVYNFGLGKRAQPYSFGLGKRSTNRLGRRAAYLDDDWNNYYNNVGKLNSFYNTEPFKEHLLL